MTIPTPRPVALNAAAPAGPPRTPVQGDGQPHTLRHAPLADTNASTVAVDRDNRRINGVSVMSVGPAAGHGFSIDATTLQTLLDALNNPDANVKTRFTHPEVDWTGGKDGAQFQVGRPINPRIEGDALRCDIQLGQYAELLPADRNAALIFALAEEDPRAIGISVVAMFDFETVRDPATGHAIDYLGRVTHCSAVDFVGDPATNRQGLLSKPNTGNTPGNTQQDDPTMARILKYLQRLGKTIQLNANRAQVDQAIASLSADQQRIARFLLLDKGDNDTDKASVDHALRAMGLDPEDPTKKLATDPTPAPATPATPATATNTPATPATPRA